MNGQRFGEAMPWSPISVPSTAIPPGATLDREQPARPAGIVADLLVPLGQSAVTGGLLAGVVVIGLGAVTDWRGGELLRLWFGLALGVTSAAWLLLLQETRRLLWGIERLAGRDLDGDRTVGKPRERLVLVNADKSAAVETTTDAAERRSQFAQFVEALPIRGTAERAWIPVLGRGQYVEYRDTLIRLGWARWTSKGTRRKGAGGWELTTTPATILDRLA